MKSITGVGMAEVVYVYGGWIVCWFPVTTVPNMRIGFRPGWEEPVFR